LLYATNLIPHRTRRTDHLFTLKIGYIIAHHSRFCHLFIKNQPFFVHFVCATSKNASFLPSVLSNNYSI